MISIDPPGRTGALGEVRTVWDSWIGGRFAALGPGAPWKSVLNLEGTGLALIPGMAGAAARKTALFTSKETGSGDTG